MEQSGDKRHDATPHRREQARRQGQVPKSQDLTSAILLIMALLILKYSGESVINFFQGYARRQFDSAWLRMDPQTAVAHWNAMWLELGGALVPLFGLLLLTAVVVNLAQVGFLFLPEKLSFDFKRLNPLSGVARIFALSNLMRLIFGLFKMVVIAAVAAWSLWGDRETLIGISALEPTLIGALLLRITLMTCLKIGVALLLLALLDYLFQRWKHEQDLRMTDQEMREEMRNLQGDPQIVARRRAVQRQLVMNRVNNLVPSADVVVTNPTELAVAIKYEFEEMEAPVVVAKGAGLLAQKIRRLALENDVPIVERKELARALYKQVDLNQPIPNEQYAAVAEVLRYVYELKGRSLPGAA